jgi:hypothetical protein
MVTLGLARVGDPVTADTAGLTILRGDHSVAEVGPAD